jgi:hypothetical protein
MWREPSCMRREGRRAPPLPRAPARATGTPGAGPPAQPDLIAGPGAGFLTEPSSCRPIYFTRRVNVIGRLSRLVDDDDPLHGGSQGFDRKGGSVHAPEARSGGPPGMQLDVHEYGSLDGLAGRRPRWAAATGIGGSHVDPPWMNHARAGARASALALFSTWRGPALPHFLASGPPHADLLRGRRRRPAPRPAGIASQRATSETASGPTRARSEPRSRPLAGVGARSRMRNQARQAIVAHIVGLSSVGPSDRRERRPL